MQTAELITALRAADAYPCPPRDAVTVLQTHISVLFFAGDRVYKVKKPVVLDFLDYSALDKRRHFCEEEVRLNRRLAPGVYLGVVGIVRTPDGAIRVGGTGDTVEYAVEMLRLPDDRMMSTLLDRGEVDNRQIDAIAALLADFHRRAETGPGVDEFGHPAEIARQAGENLRELDVADDGGQGTISAAVRDRLQAATAAWLGDHAELLRKRVDEGWIREGHGDVHAGNICLTAERIVIYDCIEFSRRFRCRDVACELAFLAMDLDLRCFRGFAGYLLHTYAELTDDPDLPAVAGFYKRHLAVVRGKVASIRAADAGLDDGEREGARREAMRYFHLAAAYTLPAPLILMCGLPGTGKSHAARAIARPFEAVILRSDVVRKTLAGVPARGGPPADQSIYTEALTRRTYAALLERATEDLEHGKPVVVDATFATASLRAPFLSAARAAGVECLLVEMNCPDGVVRARLEARARDTGEVSDADWSVYESAKSRFERPEEVPAGNRLILDSGRPDEEVAGAVIERLVTRQGPAGD